MIDTVTRFDYRQGKLEGGRTFAPENDIWIKDHRPFKFLKHPLVSGIMAVEIFMETASLLFPHLRVLGLRQMVYENILECPPGVPRETRIFCRRDGISAGEVLCQVALASRDLSPSGRPLDSWSPHYQGQIILGASVPPLGELPGFPVNSGELDTRPASPEEVRQWYEDRTSMQGRYRVLETLDGTGPDCITGTMIYRGWEDFAGRGQVNYRYSPYLLEGLLHLTNFFLVMHDEAETRKMIPAAVEEMRFTRLCGIGEILRLEGRRRATDAKGSIWDAQARDEEGNLIMQAHGLLMKWFGD